MSINNMNEKYAGFILLTGDKEGENTVRLKNVDKIRAYLSS